MIGIRELAEHLQLSIGTVSRALNNRPDVNAETRVRVLEAARQLGYAPNQSGRSLRKGKTGVVGFIMRSGQESAGGDGSFFMMGVLEGLQEVLSGHQLDLVALLCAAGEDQDAFLRRAVARGIADAIILTGTRPNDPRVETLQRAGIPFVTLGRSAPDPDYVWFDADVEDMARRAAERLCEKGHRSFATFAGNEGDYFHQHFRAAFETNLARLGIRRSVVHLDGPATDQGGYELGRALIGAKPRPSALIVLTETLTFGVYRALQESDIAPGNGIAVIGRESPRSRFLYPSLTRFKLPLRELGMEVAHGLLTTMGIAVAERSVRRLWPMELVEGDSDA